MITIGISALAHDPAIAVVKDGQLLFALEEERVNRDKRACGFPSNALALTLALCQLEKERVSNIAYYWNDLGTLPLALLAEVRYVWSPYINTVTRMVDRVRAARSNALIREQINECWRPYSSPPIHFVDHHLSHAVYGHRLSGFKRALAVVIDGRGEFASLSAYLLNGERANCLQRVHMPASLGFVYGAVTQHLGFRPVCDEYRIMGLAAYGKRDEKLTSFFARLLPRRHIGFTVDMQYTNYQNSENPKLKWLSDKALEHLGQPRDPVAPIEQFHADIANALQSRYEDVVLGLLTDLANAYPTYPLVLTGGCAMNSACNGHILRAKLFPDVYVPPAPGDQGAAAGAALSLHPFSSTSNHLLSNRKAQLGPRYSDGEVEAYLHKIDFPYRKPANPIREVALLLRMGRIGAVFQGPMEFGPRALGNRSILADPRPSDMRMRLNAKIKFREEFRPFAASILREHVSEYTGHDFESEYMNIVMPVLQNKRDLIPAVIHADGSCRFQTVHKAENNFLWRLIHEFHHFTGVPLLINTSFNVNGEPIVMTPCDAFQCFCKTNIDFLLIQNFLLTKPA